MSRLYICVCNDYTHLSRKLFSHSSIGAPNQLYAVSQLLAVSEVWTYNKHAETHSTHSNNTGDLKCPATLWAHQAVPCLQAARGTATPRFLCAFSLCGCVLFGLSLLNVVRVFLPHFTFTSSHCDCLFWQKLSLVQWLDSWWFRSVKEMAEM